MTVFKQWRIGRVMVCFLFAPAVLAQTCHVNTEATTPNSHFTEHNDGTVTHKPTGLMWKVCSEGQKWTSGSCLGAVTGQTWDVALQIPKALNLGRGFPSSANYTNWRLPNITELKSIVESQCYDPAINEAIFPNTANLFYWSFSPYAYSGSGFAWGVYFNGGVGYGLYRDGLYRVRLVRSKQ